MALFDINKYIEEQGSEEPVSSIMRPNTQAEEPDDMTDFYKRFSKSIYDAFPDKEKFRETFVKQRKTGINWDEVRRYTREADMQDAIQSSIEQAMGIVPQQEEEPEQPQGLTLVDVTDTDEGRLSNEAPLQELMSDITEEKITKEELPAIEEDVSPKAEAADQQGLMSRPTESEQAEAAPRARHRQVTLDDMPDNIDSGFLGQQEGAAKKTAYVPKDKEGKALDSSGVTIGTGVDLGSKDKNYFRYLDDPDLVAKLEPYFGKKKAAAVSALEKTPLTLTAEEVKKLDTYVKRIEFRTLKNKWNKDSDVKWEDLPKGKATAIASVYYQYGQAMFKHNFWRQTTEGLWQEAYDNLMNYGDKYPSRRKREAAILKKDM